MKNHRIRFGIAALFAAGFLAVSPDTQFAYGQSSGGGIGSKLTDASSKSKAAVDISADSMELREKEKKAVFTGNVDAKRGKVKLRSNKLVVEYVEVARKNGSKKTEVRFLTATGNVTIVSGGQTIKSRRARMDVKANKAVITGNVLVLQGKTRLNGNKLFLDLATGKSRMESGGSGGRVKAQFLPQD